MSATVTVLSDYVPIPREAKDAFLELQRLVNTTAPVMVGGTPRLAALRALKALQEIEELSRTVRREIRRGLV
jgi:hypothetical protein